MSKSKYRIRVWKEKRKWKQSHRMWRAQCTCGSNWQFWFFGATLGYGLEHLRRHAR